MEFPKYFSDPVSLLDTSPGILNQLRHLNMLPCCICGGDATIHCRTTISRGDVYSVLCKNNNVSGKCQFQSVSWHNVVSLKTAEQAINYWNFLQWCQITKPFDKHKIIKNSIPSFFDDVIFT